MKKQLKLFGLVCTCHVFLGIPGFALAQASSQQDFKSEGTTQFAPLISEAKPASEFWDLRGKSLFDKQTSPTDQVLSASTNPTPSSLTASSLKFVQEKLPEQPNSSQISSTDLSQKVEADAEAEAPSEPEAWSLFQTKNIKLGGWSQTGYQNLSDGMFNNSPDAIRQHQTWFFAEKAADGSEGIDLGFRVDYLYGTDGPDTQAFGNPAGVWDEGWDHGAFYGHAIPQLYGQVAWGDVSVKVGHFFTPFGYEVVPAPDNFFYSHSYTMFNAEPFTHTGVLSTIGMGDVTAYAGWVAGWDTGFSENGGSMFLGGAGVNLNENANLTWITTVGRIGNNTDQEGYAHSLVLNTKLTEKLKWVLQSDMSEFNGTVSSDRRSIGMNNSLVRDVNDRLSVGMRWEIWRPELPGGDRANLYAATFGLNVRPGTNLVIRPELRWNRDNEQLIIPSDDNNKFGFGCDMILRF